MCTNALLSHMYIMIASKDLAAMVGSVNMAQARYVRIGARDGEDTFCPAAQSLEACRCCRQCNG